jgi:hypothetical protein
VNISTIQKKRFLDNLYKKYYSNGTMPSRQDILKEFNTYFTINKPGFPIRLDHDTIRIANTIDVDAINSIMVNAAFNLDIVYDSLFENNEQLMSVITSLNKKIENLKIQRASLESKVDDLLFANNNTDGFFYSFTENFNGLENIDLQLSSAYVNTANKHVALSSLRSEQFNNLTVDNLVTSAPTISVYENGLEVNSSNNKSLTSSDFNYVFDGLTDTAWFLEHQSQKINYITLNILIPINSSSIISKIEGIITTTSATSILVRANYSDSNKPSEIKNFDSRKDYGAFSFSVPADRYASVEIIMYKTEPDLVISNSSNPYVYKFGLRELVISSKYYDKNGSIVSKALTLPEIDNKHLVIDAVSIEAGEQKIKGTDVKYYVAADNTGATAVSDLSWIPISASGSEESGYPSIVSFFGSSTKSKKILQSRQAGSLELVPIDTAAKNANELNPSTNIYQNKTVYRVARLDKQEDYIAPVLYGNIDSFNHYYLLTTEDTVSYYKDLSFWSDQIARKNVGLFNSVLKEQVGSLYPGVNSLTSGYIQTNLSCDVAQKVIFNINKINYNFNLAIYLNGINIADLPKGTLSKSVEWNFAVGINNIIITYDKPFSGAISFSPMEGTSFSKFGSLFTDYYNYLDPLDFQNKATDLGNYFTIDTVYGSKEIISSRLIDYNCNFKYTAKVSDPVTAIRYRVDLERFENPLNTPVVDYVKLKFKHASAEV